MDISASRTRLALVNEGFITRHIGHGFLCGIQQTAPNAQAARSVATSITAEDLGHLACSTGGLAEPKQGGKRPGGETGSPLSVQCGMRRRTGTNAPSTLPVRLMTPKN